MVKLQDGSMVFAGQLLAGEGEDDDGHSLKFKNEENGGASYYKAEAPMRDGSGRKQIYTFDLGSTQVRVSVSTVEPQPEEKEKEKKEKEGDEDNDVDEAKQKKLEENVSLRPATEARVVKTSGKK